MANNGYDPKIAAQTVIDSPDFSERREPAVHPIILQVAQLAQTVPPWGTNPHQRDIHLRSFWVSESWLSSVVYSVAARNAGFKWKVVGSDPTKPEPSRTIKAVTDMLNMADRGEGWKKLIIKTSIDLSTTDNGAWWELIRVNRDDPRSPVINIAHLDSNRVTRTGDPEIPAIYRTRYGKEVPMRWWQIKDIVELPMPQEEAYGMQLCAVSRCLMAAQIIESTAVYKLEKVSGRFTRAIDVIAGVTQRNIDDAIDSAQEQQFNAGLARYSQPLILSGIDPNATLSHVHIDLASLPENFDEESTFRWYVAQLAAAFGTDYQDIAPIMSGTLGSGNQSNVLHVKASGKGPALVMSMLEDVINNYRLVPGNVRFEFLQQDAQTEEIRAASRFNRSKDRAMRLNSGELDAKAARELAILDGDLPRWLSEQIDRRSQEREQEEQTRVTTEITDGPEQIEGGMETGTKASVGTPEAYVVYPAYSAEDYSEFRLLRGRIMAQHLSSKTRFTADNDLHVTLVYAPLMDEAEYIAAHELLGDYSHACFVTVNNLAHYGENALVAELTVAPELLAEQRRIFEIFSSLGVAVSEYSVPENWKPHITLAYVEEKLPVLEFEPFSIQLYGRSQLNRASYG